MQQHRCHINIFWPAEDDAWITDVPDPRYCSGHGDSPAQALHESEVAIGAWLEAQVEDGRSVPEPRYRPAIYVGRPAA